MTADSPVTASETRIEILSDEDGETLFATGHVPADKFLAAADAAARADWWDPAYDEEAALPSRSPHPVEHVHYRSMDPDEPRYDDEQMTVCDAGHPGAVAFTRLMLS